jgi:hypothetical protein
MQIAKRTMLPSMSLSPLLQPVAGPHIGDRDHEKHDGAGNEDDVEHRNYPFALGFNASRPGLYGRTARRFFEYFATTVTPAGRSVSSGPESDRGPGHATGTDSDSGARAEWSRTIAAHLSWRRRRFASFQNCTKTKK